MRDADARITEPAGRTQLPVALNAKFRVRRARAAGAVGSLAGRPCRPSAAERGCGLPRDAIYRNFGRAAPGMNSGPDPRRQKPPREPRKPEAHRGRGGTLGVESRSMATTRKSIVEEEVRGRSAQLVPPRLPRARQRSGATRRTPSHDARSPSGPARSALDRIALHGTTDTGRPLRRVQEPLRGDSHTEPTTRGKPRGPPGSAPRRARRATRTPSRRRGRGPEALRVVHPGEPGGRLAHRADDMGEVFRAGAEGSGSGQSSAARKAFATSRCSRERLEPLPRGAAPANARVVGASGGASTEATTPEDVRDRVERPGPRRVVVAMPGGLWDGRGVSGPRRDRQGGAPATTGARGSVRTATTPEAGT